MTVFERDDRIGGLLRYGIPDFKMEKHLIDRRMEQMAAEGVTFRTGVHVGVDVDGRRAARATSTPSCSPAARRKPRDLPVPGRELRRHPLRDGVPAAAEQGRSPATAIAGQIIATGKRVVILGGGDTGSDCLGTSNRHGADVGAPVRAAAAAARRDRPAARWPNWPMILRTSSSHEEGVMRDWSINTKRFSGDAHGNVKKLHGVRLEWVQDNGRPR